MKKDSILGSILGIFTNLVLSDFVVNSIIAPMFAAFFGGLGLFIFGAIKDKFNKKCNKKLKG
jgi:hypothetical protein